MDTILTGIEIVFSVARELIALLYWSTLICRSSNYDIILVYFVEYCLINTSFFETCLCYCRIESEVQVDASHGTSHHHGEGHGSALQLIKIPCIHRTHAL